MKEGYRTVILLILIAIAVGFLAWTQLAYQHNFIDSLR